MSESQRDDRRTSDARPPTPTPGCTHQPPHMLSVACEYARADERRVSADATPTPPRWTVSTYVTHDGDVLLVQHARLGMWLPIGGGVVDGERPAEAAAREVKEETGLALGALTYLGYDEHDGGGRLHMNHAFTAEVSGDWIPESDGSWHLHKWLRIGDEPPKGTPDNVRACLDALRRERAIPPELEDKARRAREAEAKGEAYVCGCDYETIVRRGHG